MKTAVPLLINHDKVIGEIIIYDDQRESFIKNGFVNGISFEFGLCVNAKTNAIEHFSINTKESLGRRVQCILEVDYD